MYRFLSPRPDGTTLAIAVGAPSLQAAFEQFCQFWWRPGMHQAIGVWLNAALIAVVLPGEGGEPVLDIIPRY